MTRIKIFSNGVEALKSVSLTIQQDRSSRRCSNGAGTFSPMGIMATFREAGSVRLMNLPKH